jgi:hypothetical protein
VIAWAALVLAAVGLEPTAPPVVSAAGPSEPSLMAPSQQRGFTRVEATVRPFLGLSANTFGAVSEARVEHYFQRPFMVGLEMSPLALAVAGQGPGAITHLRVHAAYATDYLALGFGVGEKLARFGAAGVSLASTLRLGSQDGLNLSLEYDYTVARNQYTGRPTLGFSNAVGALTVPLARRLALQVEGAFSLDAWVYGTIGLRQRLSGDGGSGTWFLSGSFGVAGVLDRAPCDFDAAVPCADSASALSYGPTVSFGLERRF